MNMEIKLKKCQMCKLDLPEDNIHFASRHDRGKKQYQSNCRECQKKYRRLHYLNNKQKYIDKAKKMIGYNPTTSINESIKVFYDWYLNQEEDYKKGLL